MNHVSESLFDLMLITFLECDMDKFPLLVVCIVFSHMFESVYASQSMYEYFLGIGKGHFHYSLVALCASDYQIYVYENMVFDIIFRSCNVFVCVCSGMFVISEPADWYFVRCVDAVYLSRPIDYVDSEGWKGSCNGPRSIFELVRQSGRELLSATAERVDTLITC